MVDSTKGSKYPNLASALIAFQSDLPKVTKDSTADTGKYAYSYTSLDKLVDVALPKLTAVGLGYTAVPTYNDAGDFVLRAKLIHESGEEFVGDYPLGRADAPAQAIGSVISYARRYAFLSLTGIAPAGEDDDGAAGEAAAGKTTRARATEKEAPKVDDIDAIRAKISSILASEDNDLTGDDANAALAKISKTTDPKGWTLIHYKKALAELEKLSQG